MKKIPSRLMSFHIFRVIHQFTKLLCLTLTFRSPSHHMQYEHRRDLQWSSFFKIWCSATDYLFLLERWTLCVEPAARKGAEEILKSEWEGHPVILWLTITSVYPGQPLATAHYSIMLSPLYRGQNTATACNRMRRERLELWISCESRKPLTWQMSVSTSWLCERQFGSFSW